MKDLSHTYWDDLLLLAYEKALPLLLIASGVGLYIYADTRNSDRLDEIATLLFGGGIGAIRPSIVKSEREQRQTLFNPTPTHTPNQQEYYPMDYNYQDGIHHNQIQKDYELTGQYSSESAIVDRSEDQSRF